MSRQGKARAESKHDNARYGEGRRKGRQGKISQGEGRGKAREGRARAEAMQSSASVEAS